MNQTASKFLLFAFATLPAWAFAQSTLTLDDALRLAKERNGTVRSAVLNVDFSQSRVRESFGAFLPTLTPTYRYTDQRQENQQGTSGAFSSRQGRAEIDANWRILDSGQRFYALEGNRRLLDGQRFAAVQTLREVLFSVHQQYYEALRSQELLRVTELQVTRAQKILDQTRAQVESKVAPKKDILQAEADLANARVLFLSAKNRRTTATANLRSTIGLESREAFPVLASADEPNTQAPTQDLDQLVKESLERRADLESQRRQVDAQRSSLKAANRDAGINWAIDANLTQGWTPDRFQNRSLSFNVSLPLFDGFISRENVRQARLTVLSGESNLLQAEREATAQIESEYLNHQANAERMVAARAAVEAARLNYRAAEESFAAGAEGTSIVVVLTAQVSLVTAESNYIESVYDYLISDVRLRLVTGQTVPGE